MIRVTNLQFSYPSQGFVLQLPRFEIEPGEAVALTGPSGCGKTTLLRLCAGLLQPSSGEIELASFSVTAHREADRRNHRLHQVGMVFQDFDLIPYLTVAENILAPLRMIPGTRVDAPAKRHLQELTSSTGLTPVLHHFPSQLSGGEKQRTGICRALIHHPSFILADEPTSNLDAENELRALNLLLRQARDRRACLLVVSHAREVLDRFDRVFHLPDLVRAPP